LQPSALGPQPCASSGFTLIEILVVVVILGVLAGAVTLAIGGVGGERQLARQAEQLRALLGYACEHAELGGRDIGISMDKRGYRFSRLNHTNWLPADTDELRPRAWLEGTDARLTRDGLDIQIAEDSPDKPQLVCFASGELTPFRLDLGLADLPQRYRLDGQADGEVKLAAVDTRAR
jgi:general secretion pathway protein H